MNTGNIGRERQEVKGADMGYLISLCARSLTIRHGGSTEVFPRQSLKAVSRRLFHIFKHVT